MSNPVDFSEKKRRLRQYMNENGYQFVVLHRRDNFAWFTSGGDNKVFRSSDVGIGLLLVGLDDIYLIAQYMDADRIYDDELQGMGIEKITLKWYEQTPVEKAIEMIGDAKAASDIDINKDNIAFESSDIYKLHYPLTTSEIEKYQRYGKRCDELLFNIASKVSPGMTEHEVEALILSDYAKENMPIKVLLVSSDERIDKYRHPLASNKQVKKQVFLHPAAEKEGLHFNITRSLVFGKASDEIIEKQDLLNLCEAQAMSMCRAGVRMGDILEERKKIFKAHGCEDEWHYHYPGAVSGYQIGTAGPFLENQMIQNDMPFDFFITVKGAKVEEMCLSSEKGGVNLSATGKWPTKTYDYNGLTYKLPIILEL